MAGKQDKGLQHKKAFLSAYVEMGNISQAAEAANVSRKVHYDWLKEDPDYVKDFESAHKASGDRLEQEARRRAVQGVDKPIFYKGDQVATIKEYSDTLLIFLMKGAMPEKYKDRFEHSGNNDKPIRVVVEHIGRTDQSPASA